MEPEGDAVPSSRETHPDEPAELIAATPAELERLVESWGEPRYRGRQLFEWLHRRMVVDPERMSNLPGGLRARLAAGGGLSPVRAAETLRAADGTRKIRIALADGRAVETVLIPEGDKLTQCISSQVGCAVRCTFCRSGSAGLARNLSAAEIVGQIHAARASFLPGERLRSVVFMGVGEPLHNLPRVLRALEILGHPSGMDLSSRRVTVSTVGIPRGIDRLGQASGGRASLAVSLHAADDRTRRRLVPGARAPLAEIAEALRRYPLPRRRRFTIEYVLVSGVNDSDRAARDLVKLLEGIPSKVNLLPLNPHDRTELEPPSRQRVESFQQQLASRGVSVFARKRRGAEIGAACGQLLHLDPGDRKKP